MVDVTRRQNFTGTDQLDQGRAEVGLGRLARALEQLAEDLSAARGVSKVSVGEPLARHTALRVGGPADLLAIVDSAAGLQRAVSLAWGAGVPCRLLGHGSNVLVDDEGVRGLIILNRARRIAFSAEHLTAESGAALPVLARQSVEKGLAGLEWAIGIPGSVGGALVGNAGAWGGDMASVVVSARVLEPDDAVVRWSAERFDLKYRSSALKCWPSDSIPGPVILEVDFSLQRAKREWLEERVAEIEARRRATQPSGATCGSVFKNPPGDYAGRLIDAAGLKGFRVGGAEISPVHANFIINFGGATASEVWALIDLARRRVADQFGVHLSLEIEMMGPWSGVARQTKDGFPHDA